MSDDTFSPAQLNQLRQVFREEVADAGLRLDGADHVDEARRDFMFLRSLRKSVNGTAAKIGWFVIAALLGVVVFLINGGLNMWRGQ
jgi:cell division protein FtsX